jgi:pimeloyl-ACP methyl ester carboxylesterase
MSRIALRTAFLAMGALLATLTLVVLSARLREREDRTAHHPSGGVFVSAYDTRVFIQRSGDPALPAVVFIAGTAGWSGLWQTSMKEVNDLGYQAVAVDMPPFGYSYPAPGSYEKSEQGRRLLAVMDALNLPQAVVVAHSIGAAPVMESVFSQPERFTALVLVDPALGLDSPQTDGRDTRLQQLLRHDWIAHPVCQVLAHPWLTASLLRRVISEKDRATPELVALYQRPLANRDSSAAIAKWLPEVLAGRSHDKSDDPSAYASLKLPVTLIWGATDTITPLSQGTHLQQLLPNAHLVVIPRAGHGPQFEEPDQFAAALASALRPGPQG